MKVKDGTFEREFLTVPTGKMYYIQCVSHFAHDYILWWRPGRKGYTHDLNRAGLYSEEEARSIVNCRGEEAAWSAEDIVARTDLAVSIERLRGDGIKPAMTVKLPEWPKSKKPLSGKCRVCGHFFSMADCTPDEDLCVGCGNLAERKNG